MPLTESLADAAVAPIAVSSPLILSSRVLRMTSNDAHELISNSHKILKYYYSVDVPIINMTNICTDFVSKIGYIKRKGAEAVLSL